MAVDTDFSLAMSDGICSVAPKDTARPAGMTAPAAPFVDLGAISTAGLTEGLKESRIEFKRWGSIATFKTVITSEEHAFDITFIESNPNVLGLFYRVPTPTPDATTKLIDIVDDTTGVLDVRAMVLDLMAGTNHIRFYCPRAEVTARKNPVYKTDSLIEYGVTITAYPNSAGVAVARTFLLDAVVNP